MALTPLLIRRLGVPVTNLVHPCPDDRELAGLALRFDLAAAVAARVNRASCSTTRSRRPCARLLYNAMPLQLRGRMRAFLEGIVVYAGMSIAGVVLLGARAAGSALAVPRRRRRQQLIYLGASVGARRGVSGLARAHSCARGALGPDRRAWRGSAAGRRRSSPSCGSSCCSRKARDPRALAAPAGARAGGARHRLAARARGIAPEPGRARVRSLNSLVAAGVGTSRWGRSRSRSTTPTQACVLVALRGLMRLRPDRDFVTGAHPAICSKTRTRWCAPKLRYRPAEGARHARRDDRRCGSEAVAAAAERRAGPALLPRCSSARATAILRSARRRSSASPASPRRRPSPAASCSRSSRPGPARAAARSCCCSRAHEVDGALAGIARRLADPAPEVQLLRGVRAELARRRRHRAPCCRSCAPTASAPSKSRLARGRGQRLRACRTLLTAELRYRVTRLWYHQVALGTPAGGSGPRERASCAPPTKTPVGRNRRLAFRILAAAREPGHHRPGGEGAALRGRHASALRRARGALEPGGPQVGQPRWSAMHEEAARSGSGFGPHAGLLGSAGRLPAGRRPTSPRDEVGWIRLGAKRAIGGARRVAPAEAEKPWSRLLAPASRSRCSATLSLDQLLVRRAASSRDEHLPGPAKAVITREGIPAAQLFYLLLSRKACAGLEEPARRRSPDTAQYARGPVSVASARWRSSTTSRAAAAVVARGARARALPRWPQPGGARCTRCRRSRSRSSAQLTARVRAPPVSA